MVLRKLHQALGAIAKGWAVDTILGGFPILQVIKNAANASTTAVHAAITLGAAESEVTSAITDPDVYRCLTVTGNEADMAQDVTIRGKDWAGFSIEETFTLSGTATITGLRPFKEVDRIICPARNDAGETVAVGVANKFGLYRPLLNAASDSLVFIECAGTQEAVTVDTDYNTIIATTTPDGAKDFKVYYLVDLF